jgi:8-oxo-dGTP pyrophosphatase MutT (NUDIX family)
VLKPWRRLESTRLQDCRVFDVNAVRFEPPEGGAAETFYCIEAPDWINVIPLTRNDEVLFVRQYRFGVRGFTLEIPGGMCDPGETPLVAARRELREETGHDAGELIELGHVHPNPALQGNRCFTFLARDLRKSGDPEPDAHEEFEQQRVPLGRVAHLIRTGEITHSLVVAAFHLLDCTKSTTPPGQGAGQ